MTETLTTNLVSELHKAADGLEYDGHWSVPVIRQAADELDEMKRGHILGDKELISAVITAVMSNKQGDRDDAVRALQKHIVAVERERDDREAECERRAAEVAELRLDAERYRWLRNQVEFYDGVGCFPELHGKKGQSIDEAIDAARASETKGMSAHNGKAVVAVDRLRPIDNHAPPPPDVQGWQPIETAPRDTPILLSIFASGDPERERLVVVGGSSDGVTWIDHYDYEIHPPTHWMPLPAPPLNTGAGE